MFIDFLLEVFRKYPARDAIVWRDEAYSYKWLLERVNHSRKIIAEHRVEAGTIVALEADFSPNSIALFLALTGQGCTLVPLTSSVAAKREQFLHISQAQLLFQIDATDEINVERFGTKPDKQLLLDLKSNGVPGLILFSSGSTGESKAAVHDLAALLRKFHVERHARRSISFLLFDHIGGVNTMFYQLSNAGCLVTVQDRSADAVLQAIDRHRVELLPTSPTFINLILLSEAYTRHSMDTLELVTYGTEPMLESTLRRFHELFPKIRLQQTYGLSEVGILRSKSKSSDSLWVQLGGEGFETRVVDGILQIKAESAMKGYLNAPSPFTEDGWFDTGDAVLEDGEYMRILGRESEIVNVGGEKVYPAEIENILRGAENVADVVVYGEPNAITGQMVCARVNLKTPEDPKHLGRRLKNHCRPLLQRFQIPVKVSVEERSLHGERFKKLRGPAT